MRRKEVLFIILATFLMACETYQKNVRKKEIGKYELSSNKILDYQGMIRRYERYIRKEHFRLYTLVEPAVLVKFPDIDLSNYPVHNFAGISGVVIVECYVNRYGRLIKYDVKKSGGLFFDNIVNKIISKMVFKPGRILDKDYHSIIHITFIFREDEDI